MPCLFIRRLYRPLVRTSFFRTSFISTSFALVCCNGISRYSWPAGLTFRRLSFRTSFPVRLFRFLFPASLFPASFISNVAYAARHETGGRPVGSPLMHSPIGIALRSGTEGDTPPRSAPHRRAPAPSLAPVATAAASYSYAVYTIPRMLESLQYGIGEGNLHLL